MMRRAPAQAGAICIVCLASCASHVDVGSAREAGVIRVDAGTDGSRPDAGPAASRSKFDGSAISRRWARTHPGRPY
jgi:hypothetical protein